MPHGPDSPVPESVVQDIWARQMFENRHLESTDGKNVRIVNAGLRNDGGGPDFLNAQIFIGDLRWFGDVEIHVSSGIWYEHGHDKDRRYNNVVLHVVLYPDMWTGTVNRADGTTITEIVLSPYLQHPTSRIIATLARQSGSRLVCSEFIERVPGQITDRWIHSLARRRILRKMSGSDSNDSQKSSSLLRLIFRTLGYSRNTESMLTLFELLTPHFEMLCTRREFEAWFLGVAGLLDGTESIMRRKNSHSLHGLNLLSDFGKLLQLAKPSRFMQKVEWSFARLRPANAPTVRIAQAAAYAYRSAADKKWLSYESLADNISHDDALTRIRRTLTVQISSFYKPGKSDDRIEFWRCPGSNTIDRIIINAVAPFLMLNADRLRNESVTLGTLKMLSQIRAEQDEITRTFTSHGLKNNHAFYSQGLHELYNFYCKHSRCLSCDIGQYMISKRTSQDADTDSYHDL